VNFFELSAQAIAEFAKLLAANELMGTKTRGGHFGFALFVPAEQIRLFSV